MNFRFKIWVLWLLVAALPLQGMAAATKILCDPNHRTLLSQVTTSHNISDGEHAMSHGHNHSVHQHATAHHDAQSHNTSDHNNLEAKDNSKNSVCSHCAACFIGAAAPPPVALTSLMDHRPETLAILPPLFITSFIPASLKRPPKA